jgi:acyl phosphate:glycerol-3-phosphate acyltransferase
VVSALLVAAASPAVSAACVAGAYLLGTLPTALLVTRGRGVDPTQTGSGNPGATNVYRTAGRRAGVLTLVGDLVKGATAAGVGWAVGGHGLGVACGVAAVVGHVAPATRRFQGGKGVATATGMAVVLFPAAAALAVVAFGVAAGLSRTASLGSIAAAAVLPLAAAVLGAPGREVAGLAVCALLIIGRHRNNIGRLLRGEERRLGSAG